MNNKKDSKQVTTISTKMPADFQNVAETDIVQLSRRLADSIIIRSGILSDKEELSPSSLRKTGMALGFLNAHMRAIGLRMRWFKMVNIEGKIASLENRKKK